jgi:hypothetical protein
LIPSRPSLEKPVSILLLEADMVSPAQLQVAMHDHEIYGDLRIEDILALRGWITEETIDFFTNQWSDVLSGCQPQPLGFYLQAAGLLNGEQIEEILVEQKHLGIKFGSMAVIKGWLKETTLNFFLRYIAPQQRAKSAFMERQTQKTLSQSSETESIPEFFPNQSTGQVESSEDNCDLARYLDADISWAG